MAEPARETSAPLLEVENLSVHFAGGGRFFQSNVVHAVDDVSLQIVRGETLGLVGESGSGKTTLGKAILQIVRPTSGRVELDGVRLDRLRGSSLRAMRQQLQMVFQDPYSSLDPRWSIAAIVAEPLATQGVGTPRSRTDRVYELLDLVGLDAGLARSHPFALSGGQRQRVGIARAIAAGTKLIICDEPVSALDVSVQAQIVSLLQRLQAELGVAYLFISHDLAVVRVIADHVAVMYLGQIVESAPAHGLYGSPRHPYTRALLSAVPVPNVSLERTRHRMVLTGDIPNATAPPSGCRFHTRCPWAQPRCAALEPKLRELAPKHLVACHFAEDIEAQGGIPPGGGVAP
jgi:peptide/nickel transport system ATP-binding protein